MYSTTPKKKQRTDNDDDNENDNDNCDDDGNENVVFPFATVNYCEANNPAGAKCCELLRNQHCR